MARGIEEAKAKAMKEFDNFIKLTKEVIRDYLEKRITPPSNDLVLIFQLLDVSLEYMLSTLGPEKTSDILYDAITLDKEKNKMN